MYLNKIFKLVLKMYIFVITISVFPFNVGAEDISEHIIRNKEKIYESQFFAQERTIAQSEKNKLEYYVYSSINRIGFIRKKKLTPNGFIFKVKNDKNIISIGDVVYIKPAEKSSLVLARYYTTYRTLTPDNNINANFGTQYYLTGVVEITQKESRFSVAKVIRSFRTIRVNDLLMPYVERSPKILIKESVKIKGEVICSEEPTTLIGEHNIVFINKGSKDGIAPGQYYHLYYQEKVRLDPWSKVGTPLDIVNFGAIFVLHAEERTATALVTRSEKNIYPGEKFYGP